MEKQRRKWLNVLITTVVGVVAVWMVFGDTEPRYQGKSLSDWVVAMIHGPDKDKARQVVHQMGTNHWPLLVEWLRREDRPTISGRFYDLKEGTEEWLVRHRVVKPFTISGHVDPKGSYYTLGLLALEELGPDGKAAIPTLINLLADKGTNSGEISRVAGAAYLILPKMSPHSIGPLIQALSSSNVIVQALASGALANIGTNAGAAIPTVETWLHDKRLRLAAAATLGKIGGNPRVFIPSVVASLDERYVESPLDHTQSDSLDYILEILVQYTNEARPAVPRLVEIYTHTPNDSNSTNVVTRNEIMAALMQIDPKAARSLTPK